METLLDDMKCDCGGQVDVIEDVTGWECDANEAWHTVKCQCHICDKILTFHEVYFSPKYIRASDE